MDINNRVREAVDKLEEAVSYEDFTIVEDVRKELLFLLDSLESDFPFESEEY